MRKYKHILRLTWVSVILLVVIFSCKEEIFPKPKAQLRLQYPARNL